MAQRLPNACNQLSPTLQRVVQRFPRLMTVTFEENGIRLSPTMSRRSATTESVHVENPSPMIVVGSQLQQDDVRQRRHRDILGTLRVPGVARDRPVGRLHLRRLRRSGLVTRLVCLLLVLRGRSSEQGRRALTWKVRATGMPQGLAVRRDRRMSSGSPLQWGFPGPGQSGAYDSGRCELQHSSAGLDAYCAICSDCSGSTPRSLAEDCAS